MAWLAAALLGLLAAATAPPAAALDSPDFAVVGYIPEWRYDGLDWDSIFRHLTHGLLFSIEVDPAGGLKALDRLPNPKAFAKARKAAKKHNTKLMICLGGNARSGGFSEVVANETLRATFLDTLSDFLDEHGLDGVDYNWEYPSNPEEWDGLGFLLEETRAKLGKDKVITMAYYPDWQQERILKVINATAYCDLIHSMAYDQPGRHSILEFSMKTIRNWVAAGHHPGYSTLGVPFYSRDRRTGEWRTYGDIYDNESPEWDVDEFGDVYFNNIKTIMQKTKLAKDHRLGGVMIWEVGQDKHPSHPKSLLRAISTQREAVEPENDPFEGVKERPGIRRPANWEGGEEGGQKAPEKSEKSNRKSTNDPTDSGKVSPKMKAKMAEWKDAEAKKMKEHLDKAKDRGELPKDKELPKDEL